MNEFIKKLIEKLEKEIKWYEVHGGSKDFDCGIIGAYRHVISFVKDLAKEYSANTPQKSTDDWIPCDKKLPEVGTHRDVWISLENEYVAYRANWYLDHFVWENGFVISEPILAWMPNDVPEPYKPKGE